MDVLSWKEVEVAALTKRGLDCIKWGVGGGGLLGWITRWTSETTLIPDHSSCRTGSAGSWVSFDSESHDLQVGTKGKPSRGAQGI